MIRANLAAMACDLAGAGKKSEACRLLHSALPPLLRQSVTVKIEDGAAGPNLFSFGIVYRTTEPAECRDVYMDGRPSPDLPEGYSFAFEDIVGQSANAIAVYSLCQWFGIPFDQHFK